MERYINQKVKIINIGSDRELRFLSHNRGDVVEVSDIDEKSRMVQVEVKNATYKRINWTVPDTIRVWLDESMVLLTDEPLRCTLEEWRKNVLKRVS